MVGSLYAETLAHVRSGDLEAAAQRGAALAEAAFAVRMPISLSDHINRARQMLDDRSSSIEEIGGFLAQFQPLCEDVARSRGQDKLVLFQAGTWLMDMSLTAAANEKKWLRQSGTARYFRTELKKLHVPKGVLAALDKLIHIMEKPSIADEDAAQVLTLVKEIQTTLA
jgi:hypothetical protein